MNRKKIEQGDKESEAKTMRKREKGDSEEKGRKIENWTDLQHKAASSRQKA